jgi:Helicase HerA, central domain
MADKATALASMRITWVVDGDDVWRPHPEHVEGLHKNVENAIKRGIEEAEVGSPIGLILQGQKGTGKSQTLSWTREQVYGRGGYFFLVSLLEGRSFWTSVAHSLNQGLSRVAGGSEPQLKSLMRRLGDVIEAPRRVRRAIMGDAPLTKGILDEFGELLYDHDPMVGRECRDTALALAMLCADRAPLREIGDTYMQSDEDDRNERAEWRLRRAPRSPELIVQDLSWLMALTGPSVIAIDQIDALVAQSVKELDEKGTVTASQDAMLERIANGLTTLRNHTRRTLTIVACIPDSWILLKTQTTNTVQDRFSQPKHLMTISDTALAKSLVTRRFAGQFAKVGFKPPYATWPVKEAAFTDARGFTPRGLLMAIYAHVEECIELGRVRELESFGEAPTTKPLPPPVTPNASEDDLGEIDSQYAALREGAAEADSAIDEAREDAEMPSLLRAGLKAWVLSRGAAAQSYIVDPPPGGKLPIHARLRLTLDERIEDQVHWAFRAIAAKNHTAALNRIRWATDEAGLTAGVPKRKLFLLRNIEWNAGPKTQGIIAALERAGGKTLAICTGDLRRLDALRSLFESDPENLHAWLVARKPADEIDIFRAALADTESIPATIGEPTPMAPVAGGKPKPAATAIGWVPSQAGSSIALGAIEDGGELRIDLESLRKHTAIFAGTGSGKTVLIRRLIEECALKGVSTIVLDPNNDLARLGDPWPEPPGAWEPADAAKAAEYLASTDVVVWTPRRETGRPLTFQPLPDFGTVRDDPDEFGEAVDAAVASIIPRANLEGRAEKAHLKRAVLRNAVQFYGWSGGNRLEGLIELLRDLPDNVSLLDSADKLAAELAQTLTAAMVNDPLFGGAGTPADPGLLLTPAAGKRARVSVISFIGLPSEGERQGFVNQLQMALFAWIKKNPARERPLGGLFVMDEAQTLAPSDMVTVCTQSTLSLASQARKYGLGLVFATQAPKGLHNRISGNTATQFFGLLNAPVQINAAREMAKAKGGDVSDISLLKSGQFYAAVEGFSFARVRTPLCLSYHPRSPLTTEEVIARARGGRE